VPIEIECTDDSVCVEGWSCGFFGGEGVCSYDPESGEEICEEAPVEETGVCLPPYWDTYWFDGADEAGGIEMATGSDDFRVDDPTLADSIDEGAGCSATATTPGAANAIWLLPLLLVGLARRR
jgi:MYXO-CTERM domain-containing protein